MLVGDASVVGVLGQRRDWRGQESQRKQHHERQIDRARVAQSRMAGCHGPDSRADGASRETPHARWGISCAKGGSGAGIRTPIRAFKGRCPTIERRRSAEAGPSRTAEANSVRHSARMHNARILCILHCALCITPSLAAPYSHASRTTTRSRCSRSTGEPSARPSASD
jgi:hypothetical protein